VRELQSRAAAALTRAVLGLSVQDPLSGFFVVRAATFAALRPVVAATGWKVLLELLARLPAAAAAEAPIVFRPRLRGQTKMHAGVIGAWLVQLTGLWRLRAASAPLTEATA
jgi:dolichol-phosphate mannosyltransferase